MLWQYINKWQNFVVANLLELYFSVANADGPPAWVNFGTKIVSSLQDRTFKSLENKSKDENKQNTEFDNLRKDAIAEASSGAVKKVFGGGTKKQPVENHYRRANNVNNERGTRERGKRNEPRDKNADKLQKPPEKVSLFNFLEEKLPATEVEPKMAEKRFESANAYPSYSSVNNVDKKRYDNVQQVNSRMNYSRSKPENSYTNQRNSNRNFNTRNQSETQVTQPPVDSLAENLGKMSMNSQFASRSLRQHLNFPVKKENEANEWKIGDECVAKYWEDGKVRKETTLRDWRSQTFPFSSTMLR